MPHMPNTPGLIVRTTWTCLMLIAGTWCLIEILTDFSNQWYWLILATFYTITINETFTHRICAHQLFRVNPKSWMYRFLTFMSSVDQSHGPVRLITIMHPAHHRYSDQGRADPNNMREFWYSWACVMPFKGWGKPVEIPDFPDFLRQSHRRASHIIDDAWTKFCETHATAISIFTVIFLWIVFPAFLIKILLPGRMIMTLAMFAAGVCHLKGVPLTYRHINTPDHSNNNLILHYLFLGIFGGLLQNNHHSHPNRLNMGLRWYEIDTSTPIAYLLKYCMEHRSK